MRASAKFYDAYSVISHFTQRRITSFHKRAILAGRDRALSLRPGCFIVIAFGSAARGDTSPFSDVDIAAIVMTHSRMSHRESFLFEDIVVNVSFFDLESFVEAFGTRDPWEVMWKSILIQGDNALVLYDPADCWSTVADACLIESETDLTPKIINTFWTGSIIYLGKLISAANESDEIYAVEVGGILARNVCYIILALNHVPPISNRYLLLQSNQCTTIPPNYQDDFRSLYGITSGGSPWAMATSGLRLCRQMQQLLQSYVLLTNSHIVNLDIDFSRYENAIVNRRID